MCRVVFSARQGHVNGNSRITLVMEMDYFAAASFVNTKLSSHRRAFLIMTQKMPFWEDYQSSFSKLTESIFIFHASVL